MVLWIVLRHNSATATQGHKERAAIFRDCTASDTAEAAAWPPGTSAMARRVREHDWAATPLGSVDTWSERVKAVVEMVLASPALSSVVLGPSRVLIHNDVAAELYGDAGHEALGRPVAEAFPDAYPMVASFYDRVFAGESVKVLAQPLAVGETGAESFDAYLTPVRDEDGAVIGAHMIGFEVGETARIEAGRRIGEQRLRDMADAAPVLIWESDASGASTVNGHYLDFLGVTFDDIAQMGWAHFLHPDDAQAYLATYVSAFETRAHYVGEARIRRADGQYRWLQHSGGPVGEDRFVGVSVDITDLVETRQRLQDSEDHHAFLLSLSDTLRPLSDPDEIRNAAASALGRRLGAARVAYAEDLGDGTFEVPSNYVDGVATITGRFRYADYVPEMLHELQSGHIRIRSDIANDDRMNAAERATLAAADVAASLNVPLVKDGVLVAWLGLHFTRPRSFTDREIELVAEVADRTWATVERARAEAALRESERRLSAVLDILPVGVALANPDGSFAMSNRAMDRFIPTRTTPSIDPQPAVRWEGWHPDGRPMSKDDFPGARALRGERVVPGIDMLRHAADGTTTWTNVASVPMTDEEGQITGQLAIVTDIDATRRSRQALHDSEERLRRFGEASPDVLWIRDAQTLQWDYLTPAVATIFGVNRASALLGDTLAGWLDLIVPEDRDDVLNCLKLVGEGAWLTLTYRIRRPSDGTIRWIRTVDFPILDSTGAVAKIGGIARDFTDRKEDERALAAAEARQRALVEGMPQLVWRAAPDGGWTWASPQWTGYTGQPESASHGDGWLDFIHRDDRAAVRAAWADAVRTGSFYVECRIRHRETRRHRWFQSRATPLRDEGGRVIEWIGTSTDVDDMHAAQERQGMLLAELQHRVRNTLAIVRSLVRRSHDVDHSVDEYARLIEGRVAALARTQVLLTRRVDAVIDLETIVRDELIAQSADMARVEIDGEAVALAARAAEVLTLAIHELVTNAVKHGAIGQAQGTIVVRWSVATRHARSWLTIVWRECGVVLDTPAPRRRGFGTELVTRRVPYELGGDGRLDFEPDGVVCRIGLPLGDGDRGRGPVG